LYLRGAVFEYDHSCASRVLIHHIEPTKINKELQEYTIENAVKIILNVFLYNGIYDIYTTKNKSMDLLYYFFLQIDLSIVLKDYVVET
jgi:hypothetical protein